MAEMDLNNIFKENTSGQLQSLVLWNATYLVQAIPYQGNKTGYSNPEFSMGNFIVLNLISEQSSQVE